MTYLGVNMPVSFSIDLCPHLGSALLLKKLLERTYKILRGIKKERTRRSQVTQVLWQPRRCSCRLRSRRHHMSHQGSIIEREKEDVRMKKFLLIVALSLFLVHNHATFSGMVR